MNTSFYEEVRKANRVQLAHIVVGMERKWSIEKQWKLLKKSVGKEPHNGAGKKKTLPMLLQRYKNRVLAKTLANVF